MTGAQPAVTSALGCGSRAGPAAVLRQPGPWSRECSRVSRDRDSCQQTQLLVAEGALGRSMISAMRELSYRLPDDWRGHTAPYTSAYRSSHTVVYAVVKESS